MLAQKLFAKLQVKYRNYRLYHTLSYPFIMIIKAIITTLDNLGNLQETISILRSELIDEIIVVNNGSVDGTQKWLETQRNLTVINRQNNGAGPGRNAGLDAAGKFDYALMLDGGIRPLRGGIQKMVDYLESTKEADVIGVEIPDFRTDKKTAWRRWINPIEYTYQNTRLSHTAYCLARFKAFDKLRFCEIGPFGEPGWGADDDEMMYQWNDKGIVLHVVSCQCNHGKKCTGVHPFRHASGSFGRLYRETGIWPNQYGSVYEKRVVWLQQNWPKYQPGVQWGEPEPDRIITIQGHTIEQSACEIITAHIEMRKTTLDKPWQDYPKPYRIILETGNPEIIKWSEDRRLRQFHGDTMIIDGQIVRHKPQTEAKDFMVAKS